MRTQRLSLSLSLSRMTLAALSLVLAVQAAPQSQVLWKVDGKHVSSFAVGWQTAFTYRYAENVRLAVTLNNPSDSKSGFLVQSGIGVLNDRPGWDQSAAFAVGGSGAAFAGVAYSDSVPRPAFWPSTSILGEELRTQDGWFSGFAFGMFENSSGLSRVVGFLTNPNPPSESRAFYWDSFTPNTYNNAVRLQFANYSNTSALAVNADGKIVGRAWDTATGEELPDLWGSPTAQPAVLPGWDLAHKGTCTDVSPAGSVCGARYASAGVASKPFLWTAAGGLQYLGLDGQFSPPSQVTETADGTVVVGTGPHPWVWMGDVSDPYENGNVMDLMAFLEPPLPKIQVGIDLLDFPYPNYVTGIAPIGAMAGYWVEGEGANYAYTLKDLSVWSRRVPTTVTGVSTVVTKGNVASLAYPDGDYLRCKKFALTGGAPDETVLEVKGTLLADEFGVPEFVFRVSSRVDIAGSYKREVSLWSFTANDWVATVPAGVTETTLTKTIDFKPSGAYSQYRDPANNECRARVKCRRTGIGASSLWNHEVEQAGWIQSSNLGQ